jgi:hypothetical protein
MKKRNKSTPRLIWLFTAIISGIIGAAFAYYLTIIPLYGLWKTREGVQVSAVIKKWDLSVSRSSAKSASSLRLNAEYEYQYNDVNYTGTRASLFKYEKEIYYDYWEKSELLCYIDPNDPSFSVVDKRFTVSWLLFVLIMPTVLLSVSYVSFRAFFSNNSV